MKPTNKSKEIKKYLFITILTVSATLTGIGCSSSDNPAQAPQNPLTNFEISDENLQLIRNAKCEEQFLYLTCQDINELESESSHSSPIQIVKFKQKINKKRIEALTLLRAEIDINIVKKWNKSSIEKMRALLSEVKVILNKSKILSNTLKKELVDEINYEVVNGYECSGQYKSQYKDIQVDIDDSFLFSETKKIGDKIYFEIDEKTQENSYFKTIDENFVTFILKNNRFGLSLGDDTRGLDIYQGTENLSIMNDANFELITEVDMFQTLTNISCKKNRKHEFSTNKNSDRLVTERAHIKCESISYNKKLHPDKRAIKLGSQSLNSGIDFSEQNIFNQSSVNFGQNLNNILKKNNLKYYSDLSTKNGIIEVYIRLAKTNQVVAKLNTYNTSKKIYLKYEKDGDGALMVCDGAAY